MQQLSLAQRLKSLLPTALPKQIPKRLSIGGSKSIDIVVSKRDDNRCQQTLASLP